MPTIRQMLDTTNLTTAWKWKAGLTSERSGSVATNVDGIVLANPTLAISSVPAQYSPVVRWIGHGWSASADHQHDWIAGNRSGYAQPGSISTSTWVLARQIDLGTVIDILTVSDLGVVQNEDGYFSARSSIAANTTNIGFVSRNTLAASTGNQAWSPFTAWYGTGFNTTSGLPVDANVRTFAKPVQQASGNPTVEQVYETRIDNGSWTDSGFRLRSNGGPKLADPLIQVTGGQTGDMLAYDTGLAQFVTRYATPPGLPTLPIAFNPMFVGGATNAREAFERLAGFNPTPIYVSSAGLSGNSGATVDLPTTIDSALQTKTIGSRIVCLDDMTVQGLDFRDTHAGSVSGTLPKLVDANGHSLTIRTTGPDLQTQTYANDGTFTNCWTTTLTLSGSAQLKRVLRGDVIDDYGFATPFQQFSSAALLNASTAVNGFFYDTSGKILWVRIVSGASVESNKATIKLKGLYTDSLGNSRVYLQGVALCIVGARLEGIQFYTADHGGILPRIYFHDSVSLWAVGKGFDLTACGECVISDSMVYASQQDAANAFTTSTVAHGLLQRVRSRFIRAGDTRTFAADGTLQGASAHGGSHHVAFDCEDIGNNGQGVADTTIDGSSDVTWLVNCYIEGGNTTSANIVCGSASTGVRTMYLDNVRSKRAPVAGDLAFSGSSIAKGYQTTLASVVGGSLGSYTPGAF